MVEVLFKDSGKIERITVAEMYKLGDKVTMDLEWKKPVVKRTKKVVKKEV